MSTGTQSGRWNHAALRRHLTAERLRSYDLAAGGDHRLAFSLYEWNIEAAAVVMTTTGMVEVIVRNAMDRQLREWTQRRRGGRSWFDEAPLDNRGVADVAQARDRATGRGRHTEIHGKVIAELSLGFWRYLTASRYLTSLWIPALGKAFAGSTQALAERRSVVEHDLYKLHFVRNRAAHHEPIHRRDLLADHEAALRVTGWIPPECSAWIADRSAIPRIVRERPC